MIQRNRKLLVNSIILLTIALTALIIGCGRTPPEEFWTWTTEDSTAIQTIVNEWRPRLQTSFEDGYYPVIFYDDTVRQAVIQDVQQLWMRPHYWPGAIMRTIEDSVRIDSFMPTKDTTVMVRLIERLSGTVKIITDSATTLIGDTVIGSDTYDLYTRHFDYSGDTIENPYTGACERFLHFDKKDGEWKLRKISGGTRLFIPSQNDAPYIGRCTLRTRTQSVAVQERPDTTQYGIQRLYPTESIVSFSANDTIATWIYYPANPVSFGFIHYKNHRYDLRLPAATTQYLPLQTGWSELMIELVNWEALCKRGNYNAILWVLPMQIVP